MKKAKEYLEKETSYLLQYTPYIDNALEIAYLEGVIIGQEDTIKYLMKSLGVCQDAVDSVYKRELKELLDE